MLVVCNGAMKSGSTWLYNILAAVVHPSPLPAEFLTNSNRVNSTIRPDNLSDFLNTGRHRDHDYLTKNHLGKAEHKSLLLSFDDVYVVDIDRDVRDVVVSAYYDAKNRDGYDDTFEAFYWTKGRGIADSVTRYHELWAPDGSRVLRVSYAALKSGFGEEVDRITSFLGRKLSRERISELEAETSLGGLRERYKNETLYQDDKFFRKGIVGDWQNHFSARMVRDVERIQRRGLSRFDHEALLGRIKARLGLR